MYNRLENITPEQKLQLEAWRLDWLEVGTSTKAADRENAESAVTEIYDLVGEKKPKFLWSNSPVTACLASYMLGVSYESLESKLWSGLKSSMLHGLYDNLQNNLLDSLQRSLRSSLKSSLALSLCSSVRANLELSIRDSLDGSTKTSVLGSNVRRNLLFSLDDNLSMCLWGSHEAYWVAYYRFCEQVLGIQYKPDHSHQLALWERICRSCGWWWPYEGLCIISERPVLCRMECIDKEYSFPVWQLHSDYGPALRYLDGWSVYVVHGSRMLPETRLPQSLVRTSS